MDFAGKTKQKSPFGEDSSEDYLAADFDVLIVLEEWNEWLRANVKEAATT